MKYYICLLLFMTASLDAERIACICNDGSKVVPDCGICGLYAGKMEKTGDGVDCISQDYPSRIKLKSLSCAETCKKNGGWSGNFSE